MTEDARRETALPGGIGLSRLRVYDSIAGDGQPGGSPHMHLVSGEAYYVLAGLGAVELLTMNEGLSRVRLEPGDILHFRPGTVHRLVNGGGLEILVIMQNAGLPERGDAVLTFPDGDLVDADAYRTLATADSQGEAQARRNRAVEGFVALRAAFDDSQQTGREALGAFQERALALVRGPATAWPRAVEDGATAEVSETQRRLRAVTQQGRAYLDEATFALVAGEPETDPRLGLCGHLWPRA